MDIKKYLKNNEINITNDDLDIDKLTKDLTKGMVNAEEATKDLVPKSDLDRLSGEMATLQANYETTVKSLDDVNDKNKTLSLEKEMIGLGFKEEHFDEVSKLRNTLFSDEADDKKAIGLVKEKYNATYFPTNQKTDVVVPNEGNLQTKSTTKTEQPIKVGRLTKFSDLIIKK